MSGKEANQFLKIIQTKQNFTVAQAAVKGLRVSHSQTFTLLSVLFVEVRVMQAGPLSLAIGEKKNVTAGHRCVWPHRTSQSQLLLCGLCERRLSKKNRALMEVVCVEVVKVLHVNNAHHF